ncbi:MAG: hypothetical protein WC615_21250 [Mucilaginibacter sp.]|jgi:hypothetical protein|uniref:hypothetical protein n=1 Tax=Mucilaginibacter sp. TaxID=1882438 RepID=UPI0035656C16
MFEEEEGQEVKSYIKVDVEGANPQMWATMKVKLTNMVMELIDFKINTKTNGSIGEEFGRVSANLIEFANAKLEKPSIENQKMLAEIENLLANKAKGFAETRKLNAEAEQIELQNIMMKLKLAIGCAKILATSNNDSEFLIFTKNIEELSYIFQENKIEK